MPEPTWQRVNPEDAVKALHANVCGQLATRTLRMLGACVIAIMVATNPAMARGTSSASFTIGIRIQSIPTPEMTPEQLNARNKTLYDEQKKTESMNLSVDVNDPLATTVTGQVASPASEVAP
jgi:hypothetical protein